ncbi:hypothetical protein FRC09_014699 [Ceratobasidium sp. 395]|nr:hypothetical protein FRC09_014699 [Ceratobasidium sp. 395]
MSLLDTQSQRSIIARFMGDSTAVPLENDEDRESRETHSPDTEMADAEPQRAEDEACDLELQYMEQSFIRYSHSPFNIAALEFNRQSASPLSTQNAPLEIEALLRNLSPTAYSTKQLEYRAQGYESLLWKLRNMQCSSKNLDTRRIDLINVVSEELDQLLTAVAHELESQTNAGTHHDGLRRIHFVNSNPKRYISPLVSASIVLVAIIHCMMGVARDHCNLILKCLRCILRTAANMQNTRAQIFASNHIDPIPTTLPTALNYLSLQDGLDFYVVCPSCDTLYKEDNATEIPGKCSFVNLDGLLCDAELYTEHYRGNYTWKTPLRRFSHEPLESWLARFLARPDIEDMLESTCPLCQETCSDVWGAWYMSNFPGGGEKNFFQCSANELRLSFLVYHDFFNPYTNKIAGKQRSVGIIIVMT